MKLNEIITTGLILFILFIIGLFAFMLLTNFIADSDVELNNGAEQIQKTDSVPATNQELVSTPWQELLPSNQSDKLRAVDKNSSISKEELQKISTFSLEFLKNYETFDPDRAFYAKSNGKDNPYTDLLEPFILPSASSSIISRSESNDLPGVCPQAEVECETGSVWIGGAQPTVKSVADGSIYLTLTGLVRYISSYETNPLKGRTGEKEYGLVIVNEGGLLKVQRVVSSAGKQVSI